MPNTPSAKKRLRQSVTRRAKNRSTKTAIRTLTRTIRESIAAKDVAKSEADLRHAGEEDRPGVEQESAPRQRRRAHQVAPLEGDQGDQAGEEQAKLESQVREPRFDCWLTAAVARLRATGCSSRSCQCSLAARRSRGLSPNCDDVVVDAIAAFANLSNACNRPDEIACLAPSRRQNRVVRNVAVAVERTAGTRARAMRSVRSQRLAERSHGGLRSSNSWW